MPPSFGGHTLGPGRSISMQLTAPPVLQHQHQTSQGSGRPSFAGSLPAQVASPPSSRGGATAMSAPSPGARGPSGFGVSLPASFVGRPQEGTPMTPQPPQAFASRPAPAAQAASGIDMSGLSVPT